jgi:hypothetical protein
MIRQPPYSSVFPLHLATWQVCLHVSHSNLNRRMIEIRFDKHMTIEDVKFKLHKHTGTPSHSQKLVLKDGGQVQNYTLVFICSKSAT